MKILLLNLNTTESVTVLTVAAGREVAIREDEASSKPSMRGNGSAQEGSRP